MLEKNRVFIFLEHVLVQCGEMRYGGNVNSRTVGLVWMVEPSLDSLSTQTVFCSQLQLM